MKVSKLFLGYFYWACAVAAGIFLTLVLIPEFIKTLV
jgi:hypothetical protein